MVPANVTQEGPARIITYSANPTNRNFTLGQTLYNYNFAQRSSSTNANGEPLLSTADANEVLQATQQHVAITYNAIDGRRIYVNGVQVADDQNATAGDNLNAWDDSYALRLGSEAGGSNAWLGKYRMVAIYDQALTQEQIQQNMDAGVGERYFLLFNIDAYVDVPDSYIVIEGSQFDNYSYLFHTPRYVTLNDNPGDIDFELIGMRLGINSKESDVGQAFTDLTERITTNNKILTEIGTIIPLQQGAQNDEFFLTFEKLGIHENVYSEPLPVTPALPTDGETQPRIGLRTFEEINVSMSLLTDVPTNQTDVQNTYQTIYQQLPADSDINGFLASNQVAISQLAIEYCNALVENPTTRASYFPGFDFSGIPSVVLDSVTGDRDLLIDPLITRINNTGLQTQAEPAAVITELDNLIDRLTVCGSSCDNSARTIVVAKSTCAAMLASAVMVVK